MQKDNYKRLVIQERENISRGLAQKKTIRAIAMEINRSPSTITREIKRNCGKSCYRAFSASQRAKAAAASRREGKSKIAQLESLRSYVLEKLQEEWSPEEICTRIKIEYSCAVSRRYYTLRV